jgi:hypothetical protein
MHAYTNAPAHFLRERQQLRTHAHNNTPRKLRCAFSSWVGSALRGTIMAGKGKSKKKRPVVIQPPPNATPQEILRSLGVDIPYDAAQVEEMRKCTTTLADIPLERSM